LNEREFSREILHKFVFYRGEQELSDLLDRYPGLDEYVVPVLALMRVINALLQVDRVREERQEGPVVELSTLPDGRIEARIDDGGERGVEQYVPMIMSVARGGMQFLNEKGYRLLSVLGAGQQDPEMQVKLKRYERALRLCLDRGYDDEWLERKIEEEEREWGRPENYGQTYSRSFRMRDLLKVETPEESDDLVDEQPWMRVYVEGLPVDFRPSELELRSALGQFCWARSWVDERRAVKSSSRVLTGPAWQMLERIREIALEHREENPIHKPIAARASDRVEVLKRCAEEGADHVLFERASRYVY
jgi:hypothetical protein